MYREQLTLHDTYQSTKSSKLQSIQDLSNFKPTTLSYVYDNNGNITLEPQHQLSMTYDHIKLPFITQQVAPNQGITYTAAGEVLMQDGFRAEAGAEFLAAIAPVSSTPSFQWRYAIRDHLGNTRVLFTDKNGDGLVRQSPDENLNEVLAFYKYAPFGLELSGSHQNGGQSSNRYRYNGKELEAATGFYEYGARWYDAAVGRFLGVDPIADQFPWVNVYNYAENEPVAHIDLHGLQKVKPQMQHPEKPKDMLTWSMISNLKEGVKTVVAEVGEIIGVTNLFPEQGSPDAEDFHDHESVSGGIEQFSAGGGLKSEGTAATAKASEGAKDLIVAPERMFPAGGGAGSMRDLPDAIQRIDNFSKGVEKVGAAVQEKGKERTKLKLDTAYFRRDGIKISKRSPVYEGNQ